MTIDTFLRDPSLTNRSVGNSHSSPTPADPYAMDVDATRTTTSTGNTREAFLARMRGRCFGCGSQSHVKLSCPHQDTACRYCARKGHLESVCQDKFLGLARGRGNRKPPRSQQVSATSTAPFTLFPEETTQIAASNSSTPSAPPPVASPADLSVQIAQLQELLNRANAMAPSQEDF